MSSAGLKTEITIADIVDKIYDRLGRPAESVVPVSMDERYTNQSRRIHRFVRNYLRGASPEDVENLELQIQEYCQHDRGDVRKNIAHCILESLLMQYFALYQENDAAIRFGELFGFVPDYTLRFIGVVVIDGEQSAQNINRGIGGLLAHLMRDMGHSGR